MGELTLARGRTLEFALRAPASVKFTLDGRSDQARGLTELATDVMCWRDQELMFRGRLGSTTDTLDADRHTVNFSAVDYRGLLAARIAPHDWTFEDMDQGDLAWELVQWAQYDDGYGGGWLQFTQGAERPALVNRTEIVKADTTFLSVLERFESYEDGFDWWINQWLQLECATWRGVDHADFPLAWGTSLASLARSYDTSRYANWVRVRGGKPEREENQTEEPVEPVADRWSPGLSVGEHRERRIMRVIQNHDLKTQDAVDAAAAQALADGLSPPAAYSGTLVAGLWGGPADCWLGDTVPLIVRSGRLEVAEVCRVNQVDIGIDDDGNETIGLVVGCGGEHLGRLVPGRRVGPRLDRDTPVVMTREMEDRVERLERQR